jgi:hypothetical protein
MRVMIVCSAIVVATLLNGCTGVTSARMNAVATNTTSASPAIAPAPGTTWYIRNDGGSRYSSVQPTGRCDGKHDAADPGSGTNQPCAFGDFRYLWANGSAAGAWAISGGDTVIVRGGPWRIGAANSSGGAFNNYTNGGLGNDHMYALPIPAGTSGQHTRILGENYASCTGNVKTQIFGGFGLDWVWDLTNAAFVDFDCLEITDHAQCIKLGTPVFPSFCNGGSIPFDDFAISGIRTYTTTHDILFQDVNIHGLANNGILGPVGGTITTTRLRVAFNGGAGWNFDDGSGTQSVNGTVNNTGLTIEWNGCNEEYPIADLYPAISCYDDDSGGYGDGIGTPDTPLNFTCNQCTFRYNTQDGLDVLHVTGGTISVSQSIAYGNMGQQFKEGAVTNASINDSIGIGNCQRMSAAINGAPSTFNAHLSDFCRAAGDQETFSLMHASTLTLQNDTFVGYGATMLDLGCRDSSCNSSGPAIVMQNVLALGYSEASYNSGLTPGIINYSGGLSSSNITTRNHNLFFNLRNTGCPSTGFPNEVCSDPLLASEPGTSVSSEATLDNFNINLTSISPARGAGIPISGLMVDYAGNPYSNPPSIGAREFVP